MLTKPPVVEVADQPEPNPSFSYIADALRRRCEHPKGFNHPLDGWSTSDWFTAVMGELGEAANVAKKLNRARDGIPGNRETPAELQEKLAEELADAYQYLELLAQSCGINLAAAVMAKFNKTSRENGLPFFFTQYGTFCAVGETAHDDR